MAERIERDSIGERSIPTQALYGINALRGSETFSLGGPAMSAYPYLLRSMAQIKKAAARANGRISAFDPETAPAIAAAPRMDPGTSDERLNDWRRRAAAELDPIRRLGP